MERLNSIDMLRGIAISLVLLIHVALKTVDYDSLFFEFTKLGSMGVQLFFIISGFTICMSYENNFKNKPIGLFYFRRLARIFPIYWIGIIIYTVIYGVGNSHGWAPTPETWHYFANIALINMASPESMSTVVPGGWSISTEVFFYILAPLFFGKSAKQYFYIFITLCAVSILLKLITSNLLYKDSIFPYLNGSSDQENSKYIYRTLISQMPLFIIGFFIYKISENKNILTTFKNNKKIVLAFILISTALLPLSSIISINIHSILSAFSHLYFSVIFSLLIILSLACLNSKENFFLTKIGKSSYSFYLFHFIIVDYTVYVFKNIFNIDARYPLFLITYICSFVITSIVASYSQKYLEQNLNTLSKRIIKNHQQTINRAK